MIEDFLTKIGMRCGTVKNFSATISDDIRRGDGQHWYFLTPVKATETTGQLKEATIQMAFPFLANREDLTEAAVYNRLTPLLATYQNELEYQLRRIFKIVIPTEFLIIPFWANEKGERSERKILGAGSVHIFQAKFTIKYRYSEFICACN